MLVLLLSLDAYLLSYLSGEIDDGDGDGILGAKFLSKLKLVLINELLFETKFELGSKLLL